MESNQSLFSKVKTDLKQSEFCLFHIGSLFPSLEIVNITVWKTYRKTFHLHHWSNQIYHRISNFWVYTCQCLHNGMNFHHIYSFDNFAHLSHWGSVICRRISMIREYISAQNHMKFHHFGNSNFLRIKMIWNAKQNVNKQVINIPQLTSSLPSLQLTIPSQTKWRFKHCPLAHWKYL